MGERCTEHLDYTGETCPTCGLTVDAYGNTEDQFNDYCSFPDCGCDGAQHCNAGEASERAVEQNAEGMWGGKKPHQVLARGHLLGSLLMEDVVKRSKR